MVIGVAKDIEKYFKDWSRLKLKCGVEIAKQIKKRIDQMEAAKNFSEYGMLGHTEPYEGKEKWVYSSRVGKNFRLLFKLEIKEPIENIKTISECNKIIIIGVCDYHGKVNWIIP